jgi:hypothetical protein
MNDAITYVIDGETYRFKENKLGMYDVFISKGLCFSQIPADSLPVAVAARAYQLMQAKELINWYHAETATAPSR